MKLTVLIAEDDAAVREVSRMAIARLGHHAITARDGEEALALARSHLPDLVVSDVMMPRRTGVELLRALRADARLSDVPVVLMSAAVDVDAIGAFAYLAKPFRLTDLERTVTDALAYIASRRSAA